MICLEMKEMPIIISQLGVLPKPHMTYPNGTRRPNLASQPSKGWTAPSYSAKSRYRDLLASGIERISAVVTLEMFKGTMCSGTLACGSVFRGTLKW